MTDPELPASPLTLFLSGFDPSLLPPSFLPLLARADRLPAHSYNLPALFGVETPSGQDLPVAAISRVADMGVIDHDWWIRADPVSLQPQRDGLWLQYPVGLSRTESDRLVAELNEALVAEGWLIKAPHPERWYLKPAREPRLTTTPLPQAVGRNVHPLLPRGEDRQLWHTRLNELQILLHTSSVNAERETRGQPPANSVWFWGGGRLPRVAAPGWTAIWADDPLSQGLARLAGSPARATREFPGSQSPTQRELLVIELEHGGADGAEVLHTLVAALKTGRYRTLTVLTDTGLIYRYQHWHRWRFWRRAEAGQRPEMIQ